MCLFKRILLFFFITVLFSGCGGFKRSDVKDNPINDADKRKKNIEEGRGITIGKGFNKNNGAFNFATSNEMWRASLEILDFVPLATVDYSGGVIITDWYSDDLNSDETIKIIVNFLSNEIRADGIKVVVYDRFCKDSNTLNCQTSVNKSEVSEEIKLAILKKASTFKNIENEKKAKEYRKKKPNRPKPLKN